MIKKHDLIVLANLLIMFLMLDMITVLFLCYVGN